MPALLVRAGTMLRNGLAFVGGWELGKDTVKDAVKGDGGGDGIMGFALLALGVVVLIKIIK